MDTILSIFSPRKRAPEPPKPLPHPRGRTYSRKDRVRAKRALGRISDSDTRSPRTRTSNASSITASHDTTGEISYLEEEEEEEEEEETTVKMNTPGADSRSPVEPQSSPLFGPSLKDDEVVQQRYYKRLVRKRPAVVEDEDEEMVDSQDEARHDSEVEEAEEGQQDEEHEGPEHEDEEEDDEAYTFNKILGYRWVKNKIQLQIDWSEHPQTWEPEEHIHRDAPDALFNYWRSKGGRPDNPKKPGVYDIFAIRDHSKNKKKVLVEWVGYDKNDQTWEDRKNIEKTAKDLVDDYFDGLKKGKK
ncbi:hypothetical protein CDV31_008688 [Fusarium ambrosium]|uniref:Chromo domain-containing protein n=1 Tax=Fusarium ambrosium TaxID=131363 RepID=A0A428TZ37_9HYPO|nr:hypothetical protein CDV31_008688 [Fusarium ambrosium]